MAEQDKPVVHIDYKDQDPNIPDVDKCPKCNVYGESGYGLAGGGIGVYTYCPECGMILSKTQDQS